MARARDSFSDLSTRILTGLAIAVVGLAAVWAGAPWFTIFVAAIIGILVWELAQMLGARTRPLWVLVWRAGRFFCWRSLCPWRWVCRFCWFRALRVSCSCRATGCCLLC
jgi:CDP-diglyceride synthetase